MRKILKYGAVSIVALVFLLAATAALVPLFVDRQKVISEIERNVSAITGRTFSLGPQCGISVFPWLELTFSDVKLGNPKGFSSDEFITISTIEARLNLFPLLSKQIQLTRLVVGGLEVNLETKSDGRTNWDFELGYSLKESSTQMSVLKGRFLAEEFSVALFAITDGKVSWRDEMHHSRHHIDDLLLLANNFTFAGDVDIDLKATVDDKNLTIAGNVGPLVLKPGHNSLPVDITFSLHNKIHGQVQGKISGWPSQPKTTATFLVKGIDVRALLRSYMAEDAMTGTMEVGGKIDFAGYTSDEVVATVNGKGHFLIKDGTLEGVDLSQSVRDIDTARSRDVVEVEKSRTDFSELQGEVTIWNGLITSPQMILKSPLVSALISGTADLVSQQLNLEIEQKAVLTHLKDGGREENIHPSGSIVVRGPFSSPELYVSGLDISKEEESLLPEKVNVQALVDEKLLFPEDDDVKGLVGKALIDPAVVAQRFGLKPKDREKGGEEKQGPPENRRIRVNQLQIEDSFQ